MATHFKIARSEFLFAIRPTRPFFGALDHVKAVASLFEVFEPFGVKPTDIQVQTRGNTPGDVQYQVWFGAGSSALATLRFDSVEFWSASSEDANLAKLVQAGGQLLPLLGAVGVKQHRLTLKLHGTLRDGNADDWLAEKTPAVAPGWRPSGASWQKTEGPSTAIAVIERSEAIEGGLFLSLAITLPGDVLGAEASRRAAALLSELSAALDLTME